MGKVKRCEKQLQKCKEEEQRVKEQVRDRKRRLAERAKDRNWAKVNKRNKGVNNRTDFEVSQKEKEAAAKKAASTTKEKFNPFARRRVKPKILWKVGQAEEAETEEKPDEEEKKDNREAEVNSKIAELTAAPTLVQEQANDSISQSHQFTID